MSVELSRKVIGCCYEVSNTLGAGFLENVYENALSVELERQELAYRRQVPLEVYYKEEVVGRYQPDFLVADKLIVEIKAVSDLSGEHQAQLLNYLRATGLDIGLLVNFGRPRIQVKRLVN